MEATQPVCVQEYELAVCTQDAQRQHAVLKKCREAPNFSAESMLKLATLSKAAPNSSPDNTREALHAAMKLLLAKGHAVPYDQVAQVRMCACMCSSQWTKTMLHLASLFV